MVLMTYDNSDVSQVLDEAKGAKAVVVIAVEADGTVTIASSLSDTGEVITMFQEGVKLLDGCVVK